MRLTAVVLLACILLVAFLFPVPESERVEVSRNPLRQSVPVDSSANTWQQVTRSLTTPAFEERKAALRKHQQQGYAFTLAEKVRGDGLAALLTFVRLNARVRFTLSHRIIYAYLAIEEPPPLRGQPPYLFTFKSGPMAIPLYQEWELPGDPWSP